MNTKPLPLLSVALALAACGLPDPPPSLRADASAGPCVNLPACPGALELGKELDLNIERPSDSLNLRFVTKSTALIEFSVQPSGPATLTVDVLDEKQGLQALARAQSPAPGSLAIGSVLLAEGSYQLRIARAGINGVLPVKVRVSSEASDPNESNDTFAQATKIEIDKEATGKIYPAGDTDMFEFTTAGAGVVGVTVNPPQALDLRVDLFDDKQAPVPMASAVSGAGEAATFATWLAGGKYFLRIRDSDGGRSSQGTYSVRVTLDAGDPLEPNQTFAEATELKFGQDVKAKLYPAGDVDFFHFTTMRNGVVDVTVTPPVGVDLRVDLFDASQTPVPMGSATNAGVQPATLALALGAGKYFLRVRDTVGPRLSAMPYTVRVTFDASDAFEPNQSLAQASAIKLGQDVTAKLYPAGDQDSYQFKVDAPGVLETAVIPPPGLDLRVDLFEDPNGANVLAFATSMNGVPAVIAVPIKPGTYFLRVREATGPRSSPMPYTFKVTLDTTDVNEVNNAFSEATPLKLDTDVMGKIRPVGDVDVFRFTTPKAGVVDVAVDPVPTNLEVRAELLDEKQELVPQAIATSSGGRSAFLSVALPAGNYFLRLRENAMVPQRSSTLPYKVRVTLDTSDPGEVNDSFAQATALEAGAELSGKLRPVGDIDTFKVVAKTAGMLIIDVTSVPAGIEPYVEILAEKQLNTPTAWMAGVAGQSVTTFVATRPDTYFVRIFDRRAPTRGSSEAPYKVRATLDTSDTFEPNQLLSDSPALTLPIDVAAKINPDGDVDVFQFAATPGNLLLVLDPVPGELVPTMTLYDPAQRQAGSVQATGPGQSLTLMRPATAAGTYFVMVRATGRSEQTYRLRVTQL